VVTDLGGWDQRAREGLDKGFLELVQIFGWFSLGVELGKHGVLEIKSNEISDSLWLTGAYAADMETGRLEKTLTLREIRYLFGCFSKGRAKQEV
jgi:hypothetical protein